MLAKQSKQQKQDRKSREVLERKISEFEDVRENLERNYDMKVMEYETLLRDFEDAKFDQMKRLKNTMSSDDRSPSTNSNRVANVINTVILNKLNSNAVAKLSELPPRGPQSAPELPSLGARRPTPGAGITRSPLDNPRVPM
eukprot:GILK01014774.1.p1 GENE.GILK01014774.1~~GILK01014774.1.p1  ORF type:complete len:141 (+),score=21.18 GILK01014774.1:44-466(+)